MALITSTSIEGWLMKTLSPYAVGRMTCLCHEARLRFGKVMWAWLDDERFTVASKLLFGETTCH
jgi:hypothetical protein